MVVPSCRLTTEGEGRGERLVEEDGLQPQARLTAQGDPVSAKTTQKVLCPDCDPQGDHQKPERQDCNEQGFIASVITN